ncbi:phospholipase D family protein [Marivirga arenosa]|uniref:Phospholipase D family protein n=1 Tax=Marivirga arenosa TaxID=3059076 RepID=A0AA51N6G3_9BACT|nr:phospholipase D family protein [Marivirga sp. ABR2-2]WMN06898.1 phospholipase D family protein [Marivirga sp. ABR2-2]
MAEFLTTRGVSFKLEDIIINAKEHVTLVSPYLKISQDLYTRLIDASNRGLRINIIYGKDNLSSQQHQDITNLNSVFLFFCQNLHAKCYFNESHMIITSMNMYDFSERNNREMGVFIDKNLDSDIYRKTISEVDSIIDSAILEEQPNKNNNTKLNKAKKEKDSSGHCIRCNIEIPHNPERPYCYSCFSIWSQFENIDYDENYCHSCGSQNYSTMRKPQCRKCWSPVYM